MVDIKAKITQKVNTTHKVELSSEDVGRIIMEEICAKLNMQVSPKITVMFDCRHDLFRGATVTWAETKVIEPLDTDVSSELTK